MSQDLEPQTDSSSNLSLLQVKNLVKYYPVRAGMFSKAKGSVKAVDGISLNVKSAENYALVGESGCGKTTLGRVISGLVQATSGTIEFEGRRVMINKRRKEFTRSVQPIFQDPYSSLNPIKTIKQTLSLPYRTHSILHNETILSDLLESVGLVPGKVFLTRYPHELSGGQRQRVAIARAIALKPRLIVADEPVSGLDVTVQEQILELLKELQRNFNTTYFVISHDISMVKNLCQRVGVMYLGKIIETGPISEVVDHPFHPYTISLLKSFPSGDPDIRDWVDNPPITGHIPSAVNPPSGCRFRTRCPLAEEACAVNEPEMMKCGSDHFVACPVVLR